jgi:hypothetical protein
VVCLHNAGIRNFSRFNQVGFQKDMVTDEVYNLRVQALFPDNMYGVDSGGDPTVIPNLTFQQFQVCFLCLCGWTSK